MSSQLHKHLKPGALIHLIFSLLLLLTRSAKAQAVVLQLPAAISKRS